MLRFEHVSLSYGSQKILDDLSFEIQEGQMAVLIGPSGCGKTTTLKMINRLIEPSAGKIYLNEEDITAKDKVELRRHIGYVIQQIGLFPNMTVAQNICVVPTLLKYSKEECDKIVHSLLELVNMPYEQYAHKYPSEMSGGQQQRIGILRALAASPPIVLMDEPFSALDPMTRRSLQQEVRSLQQKLNKTFVFVTHDMEEALDLADVIIFMDHGKIVQMAPPEEMLAHPASGQIQDFLGKFIDTHAQKELTAADFMRPGVSTVSATRGVNECVSKMQRRNVDTLIVVDDQDRYQGTVSIADIRLTGHVVKTIEPLLRCNTPTVHTGDSAKDCFDLLISSGAPYLIVLDEEEKVDGLITKTSMTSAMAEQLWGCDVLTIQALPAKLVQHLFFTLVPVAIGFLLGVLIGILLSRKPKLSGIVLPILSVFNTIPGIVFIGLLGLGWGAQSATVLVALGVYATFPVLKNTYAGLVSVDPQYIEAAKGCGMSAMQSLTQVELPLAMPTIIGGLRMSTVYTVSWAVLASMIGGGGLGDFIYAGISSNANMLILMGAIPAALLAFVLGSLVDALQRKVVPKGIRRGGSAA